MPETFGFVPIGPGLFVEQSADEATRNNLREAMEIARKAVISTYGDAKASPVVNACVTERCFWLHGGRGEFAKVFGNRILLSPRGLNWHFIGHEWSHAEMFTRLNLSAWKRLPQWFDEGVAVAVSEAPEHSEEHWQFLVVGNIARPAREELYALKTLDEWLDAARRYSDNKNRERRERGETEIHSLYAAAGHEVRPWLAQVGTPGLLGLIDRLNAGETFEAAYPAPGPAMSGALRDKSGQAVSDGLALACGVCDARRVDDYIWGEFNCIRYALI